MRKIKPLQQWQSSLHKTGEGGGRVRRIHRRNERWGSFSFFCFLPPDPFPIHACYLARRFGRLNCLWYTDHRNPSTWSSFLAFKSIARLQGTHLSGLASKFWPCNHRINPKTGPLERNVTSVRSMAWRSESSLIVDKRIAIFAARIKQ